MFAVLAVGLINGCSGTAHRDPTRLPEPFELEVAAQTTSGRHTAFVLEPDGRLFFAGGTDAVIKSFREAGSLSEDQRLKLWTIILAHDLLDADGSWFPPKFNEARYRLVVRAGRFTNRLTTGDDQSPGVVEVHGKLDQWHRQRRVEQIMAPIRSEMQRRGE
jgi:hypothetical protein